MKSCNTGSDYGIVSEEESNSDIAAIGIIPARIGSTRLPGKPLADICGKPLVVRVAEGCLTSSLKRIIIATDSKEIADVAEKYGIGTILTGQSDTGTDRVFKAWKKLGCPGNRILNIQGDEPQVNKGWIDALLSIPPEPDLVVTLARPISSRQAEEPDRVKVVLNPKNQAIYFSRLPVPFGSREFNEHVGIYCFSPMSLEMAVKAPRDVSVRTERLEQLFWLSYGIRICVITGDFQGVSVDTPEDLEKARKIFRA